MTAWKTPLPPGDAPQGTRAPRRLLLLPLAALPFWGWTLWTVPGLRELPAAAVSAAPLLLLAALALLLDRRDRRVRELGAELAGLRADTAALADEHLPRLVERLRAGDSAETALHRLPRIGDPGAHAALKSVAAEIAAAERRRSAAMVACATAAGRVQALTTTMLADLRRMQERHGDGSGDDVLGDLMHLDHSTAQAGRIADSIAVLTGARSGRRWGRAIAMESVVRGAMGRIGAYRRVRVHNVSDQAVAGFAAEGVIHALAEVLDNAAKFSPPTAEVHVHVEEVQAGIAVMVEDGGLVMGEEALRRARSAVENRLDLSAISGTRLGLSVVGRIAHRYGLSVSFRPSSRGGTAVVLLLPRKLVKPLPEPPVRPEPEEAASTPVRPGTEGAGTGPLAAAAPAAADGGLPQRRRGQTLAAAESAGPRPRTTRPATAAQGFGAFRSAVRGQDPTGSPKDA
ncbi:ATP-binding protein [Nocardiopsis sp. CA-288880]|uniref:ATP-binding protein n=1 Tax=Nocardiopsis sp. CA-288880 TaxID=3239995 RepID=UPI003D957B3A